MHASVRRLVVVASLSCLALRVDVARAAIDLTYTVPVTVHITEIHDIATGSFDTLKAPDFHLRVTMDTCVGQANPCLVIQEGRIVDSTSDINDYQTFTFDVPVTQRFVGVSLFLADHDGNIFTGTDDVADIDPTPNHNSHEFAVDMACWDGSTLVTTSPNVLKACTQGDNSDIAAKVCYEVTVGASRDQDGDGLLDSWELQGHDVDGNCVLSSGENLPDRGANPSRPDVFVEVDCLVATDHNHCPLEAAIADVVTSFANAPVRNPDGTTGVQLHVDVGPLYGVGVVTSIGPPGGVFGSYGDLGGGNTIPEAGNTTFDSFNGPAAGANYYALRRTHFDRATRLPVWRYAIFGHQTNARKTQFDCTSGQAETLLSNDFFVTLGGFDSPDVNHRQPCWTPGANGFSVGSRAEQAGTFMHELGHTLGLHHGGASLPTPLPGDINLVPKPNYLSVMNYDYQACDATGGSVGVPRSPDGTIPGGCDYSRFALPQLDETSLDECVGLGGHGFGSFDWNHRNGLEGQSCIPKTNNAVADVNRDGYCIRSGPDDVLQSTAAGDDIAYPTRADIPSPRNEAIVDGFDRVCNSSTATGSDDVQVTAVGNTPAQDQVLHSSDDWQNLQYNFRSNPAAFGDVGGGVEDEPDSETLRRARENLSGVVAPVIKIDNQGPATILPGQTVTWTVVAKNTGFGPALDTHFFDTPPGASQQSFDLDTLVVGASGAPRTFEYAVPASACPQDLVNIADATYRDMAGKHLETTASATTRVLDIVPPTLTLSISPTSLWPPDHRLVPITATITVTDNCDPNPTVRLVSISSNEPDNGLGDGDTANDVQGANLGTDDRQFLVRAERSGLGTGRVYTVTYEAADASGNTTRQQATVTVPNNL